MIKTVKSFLKNNTVCAIAFFFALLSCFFVTPDKKYVGYIDFKTVACLFSTLAVVCALRNIMFFTIVSRKIVRAAGNLRTLAIMLVVITFVGSMLIANDMALITFLPLGYLALSVTGNEKYSAYIFILQNISANLGGMLTPFGNPQNLYLYSYFNIPTAEFTKIMLPPFVLAVLMLVACCLPLSSQKLTVDEQVEKKLDNRKTAVYILLFALSVLAVFRVLPYMFITVIIVIALFIFDKEALKAVDYPLIFTFVFFFVFAGNMSRMNVVHKLVSSLLRRSTFLFSVLSCQVISNVPSAILLSKFTQNYKELLLGVNLGGTGTIIASLASLITFSEFKTLYPEKTKHYLLLFAGLNVLFLGVLTAVTYIFFI